MSSTRERIQRRREQQAARRKRVVALAIAAAGLLLVGLAALLVTRRGSPAGYSAEFSGGPRLELEQDVYDYGYVKLDTVITTDVKISNVGDEPLQIAEVPVVEVREGC